MAQYRNPAIRQLTDQQVRFVPLDVRLQQIERAEQFLDEIEADREYKYQELCHRVTAYRPEMYPDLVIGGRDAAHDLRLFIEDLSDSANIAAETQPERVLTVEDLSREFHVSTKTVDRWRDRGLVSRRFVFGNRKRVGFLLSSVQRFVAKHSHDIERGARFSQLSEPEREQIISRARRLARFGGCPAEINRRVARKMGRAQETIRYTIKSHDRDHPDSAVFPNAADPLSDDAKREIFNAARRGVTIDRLARKYERTRASVYRIVAEMRAVRLLEQPIEFIFHSSFESPVAEQEILVLPPQRDPHGATLKPPPGLPPYLSGLYSIPLLTKEEEAYYFRKMNFLKFAAARLRDQLDVARAKARVMDQIERDLDAAMEVKNLLIRSNLRLVVSVAKRHIKPNGNFFEMVSDGNMSLIRAIEKFDYSKGFKFSTYASWAIMKNFARSIPAEHTHLDRYRTGNDDFFLASPDIRGDQFEQEMVNSRQREAIMRILDHLEEREKNIILYRFGLHQGGEPQTLEQLGSRFGVTKERIRQLESRALGKLRKIAMDEKLDIPGI